MAEGLRMLWSADISGGRQEWSLEGDLEKVCKNVFNVFDPVVTEEHLELNYLKSIFHQYGAITYQMTGSGSAVFAIVSEFEVAAVICNMLKENYPQVFIAKPV